MKKFLFFFIIIFAIHTNGIAQFSRYIIQLKDKSGTPYSISNPSQFLSQRSIARRQRYSIAIDSTDLPITPAYIDSISAAGNVTILNVSKWFNQVCIKTTDATALAKINSFPFVIAVPPIAARPAGPTLPVNNKWQDSIANLSSPKIIAARPSGNSNFYDYGVAYPQIHLNEGEFLHNHGFRGKGMQIAITDEGFYNYTTLPTFDSTRNNNQVLGTWNYVSNDTNVNEGIGHGLACFSTIAANLPGVFVGTAPQTSFYLYVTEDVSSEYPVEEQNWAAAAEKADSLGVDVVSVSLGYNTFDNSIFDYTYADMNGHYTLDARAANFASNKGMLIVVAAGNEGESSWHYIDTPGDADSALSLGAVDTGGIVAPFSSYGPNSSGQTKPDVAAVGSNTIIADDNTGQPSYGSGTSFATPIMAGLSACLWQAFPEVNNMVIIDALHKASSQANNPDNRVGYGIPDMKKAFIGLIEKLHTQNVSVANCNAVINWTAKCAADMYFVIKRKLPSDNNYQPIDTQSANTNFTTNNFTFSDNLALLPAGTSSIQYKIEMDIATDTSFYLDSATVAPPTVTAITPVAAITDSAIVFSTHDALLNGSLSAGCNSISGYGFEYSSNINFANGTDTTITVTNINEGNFAASLTGLAQNTTYYYKAFVTNNDTVTYGSEHSFTTLPIPNGLIIYPSPAPHSATIHYSVSGITPGQYALHIYNSVGQLVFNKTINPVNNFIDDDFILPVYLSAGLYSLQVAGQGFNIKKPFITY